MEHIGTFEPDNLYAGGFPEARETITIPAGVAVKRGDILSEDGRPIVTGETPDCIALDNIPANAPMRVCTISYTGDFNANALFTGDNSTPMDWKKPLRKLNIFVRQPAP